MQPPYDAFLSYHWRDHALVEAIAQGLRREHGLNPFLDRWYLAGGQPWPGKLQSVLGSCRSVVVCIGSGAMGPWQQREVYVALERQGQTPGFPVVPLMLPGAEPALGFLNQNTWIDLRHSATDPAQLQILAQAIRGEPPGPDARRRIQETLSAVSPYRGLLYFREEDAPFYFGRDAAIRDLQKAIGQHRFIALVGASGSGKSSLLRAGLVPALRRATTAVWEAVTIVPTDRPLHAVAAGFLPLLEAEMSETDRLAEANKLAERLGDGSVAVRDVVARVLAKQQGTDRLLLVVDQWEETVTLTRDTVKRRLFIEGLLEASEHCPVTVMVAVRGDFVGSALLAHRGLSDRVQHAQVNLGPLKADELDAVIARPAQHVGLEFEPGLKQRIRLAVAEEPGNLPLLEFVLKRLWETRHGGLLRHEAYEAMGELRGAIAQHANETYARLSPAEQEAAKRVFTSIVRPGEGVDDTRRRVELNDLQQGERGVVQKLADARLVVTALQPTTGTETVEVAHEALIRHWELLKQWVEEDREFLLWRERLRGMQEAWEGTSVDPGARDDEALLGGRLLQEATEWLERRRERLSDDEGDYIVRSRTALEAEQAAEQARRERELQQQKQLNQVQAERIHEQTRSQRRLKMVLAVTVVGLLGMALLGGLFWKQKKQAVAAASEAIAARNQAESIIEFMVFELRDKLAPIGRLDIVEAVNQKVEAYYQESGTSTSDKWTLRRRMVALGNKGDLLVSQGKLKEGLAAYQSVKAIAEKLAGQDPSNAEWQRDLSLSYANVGNVLSAQGQLVEALAAYQSAKAIAEKLAEQDPGKAQWQRNLSVSYAHVGDVLGAQGQLVEALAAYQSAKSIAVRLAEQDPSNAEWQRDLSLSYANVGDVLSAQGRLVEALAAYQSAQAIAEKLAGQDPSNAQWQRDLLVSHAHVGDVLSARGQLVEALAVYQSVTAIAEKLAGQDPNNAQWQRDLSLSYGHVGTVLSTQGQPVEALAAYQSAKAIAERLAEQDPSNAQWQRDLSLSYANVGDVLSAQGQLVEALAAYQSAKAIAEKLAEQDPSNANWREDLEWVTEAIADIEARRHASGSQP